MLQPLADDQLKPLYRKTAKALGKSNPAPIRVYKFGGSGDTDRVLDMDRVILYYPTMQTAHGMFGHYVCMIRDKSKKTYFYFDPVGSKPDDTKNSTNLEYEGLVQSMIEQLEGSDWQFDYSNYKLQPRGDSDSCGYWCILRLIYKDLSGDQFAETVYRITRDSGFKSPEQMIQNLF